MSQPQITAICLTFARVRHLENAIANFLDQDYDGPREMIVYNTCLRQKLDFDHPLVKVINAPIRPSTIGETRNAANACAKDGLLVVWDDDDAYCRGHLSNFARHFNPDKHDWVWLDKMFYMEGTRIKGIVAGTCNTFAYTKKAWLAAGMFANMNTGEDRNFQGRVTQKFDGIKVPLSNQEASFVYRWGQGESVYHLSGLGEDKPGQKDGLARAGEAADIRLNAFLEPPGDVKLTPKADMDYDRLAAQFTGGVTRLTNARRGRIAIVSLGHMGDIINVLPIAFHIFRQTGRKPLFVSTQKYGGMVLDGCSYIEPLLLDIDDVKINDALAIAGQRAEYVLNAQVYGENFTTERSSKCYNVEQWRVCGFEWAFDNRLCVDKVFDQTDGKREQALLSCTPLMKPLLLLHLTGGNTSPFKDGVTMRDAIMERWSAHFQIVDLSAIKAERIYDMGMFLENAKLLISSDTYTLHLAADYMIPVVAIVNDCECFGHWMRTSPQCNAILQLDYSKALASIDDVHAQINQWKNLQGVFGRRNRPPEPPAIRRIFHAVEIHPDRGMAESTRKAIARLSWDYLYREKGVIPCHCKGYTRTAREIGDSRDLPFLRDVLAVAMGQADGEDIVMWTNDDVLLQNEIADAVRQHCSIWGACTAMRTEFKHETAPSPSMAPEDIAAKGERHMGRDLFAATKVWLLAHWDEIPDAILGAPAYDLHLAALVRHKVGQKTTRQNIDQVMVCAELPNGYVYHQHHVSQWASLPQNTPSHVRNGEQFKKWAAVHQPHLKFWGNMI
jgi:hypothetical protein